MELQHVNVKIFAETINPQETENFILVFHQWIQDQVLYPDLLIDVADYRHVPEGPGVVLIGHEADFSMDNTDGRWGLRYNRKADFPGEDEDRFNEALKAALNACLKLEADERLKGKLKFNRQEIELFINDRALAPNTPETRELNSENLNLYFEKIFSSQGLPYTTTYNQNPRERFGVVAKSQKPLDFEKLLENFKI